MQLPAFTGRLAMLALCASLTACQTAPVATNEITPLPGTKQATDANSIDFVAQLLEGKRLYRSGRYEAAERALLIAAKADPGLADAHIMLGNIYFNWDRPQDSIAQFERAVEVEPGNLIAVNNLTLLYLRNTSQQMLQLDKLLVKDDPRKKRISEFQDAIANYLSPASDGNEAAPEADKNLRSDTPSNIKPVALKQQTTIGSATVDSPEVTNSDQVQQKASGKISQQEVEQQSTADKAAPAGSPAKESGENQSVDDADSGKRIRWQPIPKDQLKDRTSANDQTQYEDLQQELTSMRSKLNQTQNQRAELQNMVEQREQELEQLMKKLNQTDKSQG